MVINNSSTPFIRAAARGGGSLATAENRVMAVADGRLYNADELDVPADVSLAQQLIILYERFGFTDALARINGDFAAALFDAADETLWLGRDRVGHRPLYYVSNGERAAFCSQPRNLLEVPGVSSTVNRRWTAVFAGMHYRYFANAPQSD